MADDFNELGDLNDEELHESLVAARNDMTVRERTQAICDQLTEDWERYREDLLNNRTDTGSSPVNTLKLEAMAHVLALADFHCAVSRQMAEAGEHQVSHHWALDEGALRGIYIQLCAIDTELA